MRAEIRSLTGLRGLAACWVMIGHYVGATPQDPSLRTVVMHMYIAVDLFMVLSGFVLAMTYQAGGQAGGQANGQAKRFLLHRLARIYPLYAVTTLVCLLLFLCGAGPWGEVEVSPPSITANLLMVQSWAWPESSLNAAGWSLSIEWAANLLFPLLVVVLLRGSWRRGALVAAAALACLAALAVHAGQDGMSRPATGPLNCYEFPGAPVRCISEFVLGMFCWRLRAASGLAARLGGTASLLAILTALAILSLLPTLDVLFVLLTCALLIGLAAERSPVAALFGMRLPRRLGLISFSMYLWHIPLIPLRLPLAELMARLDVPHPWAAATAALMLLVLGVSPLSLHWLEQPLQRRLRAAFDTWLPSVAPAGKAVRLKTPVPAVG